MGGASGRSRTIAGALSLLLSIHACSATEREFGEQADDDSAGAGSNDTAGTSGRDSTAETAGAGQSGGTSSVEGSAQQGGAAGGQEPDPDGCADLPCQNGGLCQDTEGDYECTCDADPSFTGKNCELLRFEPLPSEFVADDISPEGSVVVGNTNDRASKVVGGKEVDLGTYIGDANSLALGVSANGALVVGASGTGYPLTTTSRAVRWKGTSIAELEMPEGYTLCEASDVSADGSVIAGTCDGQIVRWVAGALQELGKADGVDSCQRAILSDDGKTIGGVCFVYPNVRSFIWTEADGFNLLVNLQTTSNCAISNLSTDGSSATGYCSSGGSFTQALYWSAEGGSTQLLGAEEVSLAAGGALTGDGSFVVGHNGYVASVWDDLEGVSKPLLELLPASLEALQDWELREATCLSTDGRAIVGKGFLSGVERGFIARID